MPGRRFVVIFFALGAAIAGLVVLVTVLVVREPGATDPACREAPAVCTAVRDYVDGLNDALPQDERMEDLHVTSVSVTDGTATARVRFTQKDVPYDVTYALGRQDGGWAVEES